MGSWIWWGVTHILKAVVWNSAGAVTPAAKGSPSDQADSTPIRYGRTMRNCESQHSFSTHQTPEASHHNRIFGGCWRCTQPYWKTVRVGWRRCGCNSWTSELLATHNFYLCAQGAHTCFHVVTSRSAITKITNHLISPRYVPDNEKFPWYIHPFTPPTPLSPT